MTKSKKPTSHPEPETKTGATLDRSSLPQEQNPPKPAGGSQEKMYGEKSQDTDGSQDFIGPKGMDT
ncbi:MAG TPA: hypothetical protein VFN95_15385 [Flavitalea sp.]|nr:hypothetical protein [Flavitalea sp.]